ncbi:hypothetical protein [Aureibacter tunicatorum]|uniref:Uncharacterized protein n=1 Tax=Aureibacter tunicatorum TaxID=866807 RepID=A0AAE3XNU3_9BACT|nr:hypothetical protein [Aureibacter tunicatorum]MDR6239988.1 hypothetical protein [Aureibacter tunicatorum]BDD04460.1 hypothetical protein AUTU_19430 [Aureibacter tunicatorum]
MTEHEIQKYIWENKDEWEDLIIEYEFPEEYRFNENEESIYSLTPDKLIYNELLKRLKKTYDSLYGLRLFGCEVPLKKDGDSTIRADLMGVIEGNSGIALIELKKSAQTERQAYTELLAYASHLHSIFPTFSKDDITFVLISPMEERIVREATIFSFLFDEKPVFAYIPTWTDNDVKTLKLTPWIPTEEDIIHVTQSIFSQKNFEIFKVTWDKIDDWNAEKGENPSEYMIERMNSITSYAAQLMESKGVHGFVYTSQAYPELPFLPNALIVAGINPFKIAKDNYLIKEGLSPYKLDSVSDDSINILQIIPELANKAKKVNEENCYLYDLITTWTNTITGIAFETVNLMTSNDDNQNFEKGWGGMTWEQYQTKMLEDALCFNFNVRATGLIRKLFVDYTREDYKYLTKYGYENHPSLSHGDIPTFIVDYLNEQHYFRNFLQRLFDPYHEIRDDLEDYE